MIQTSVAVAVFIALILTAAASPRRSPRSAPAPPATVSRAATARRCRDAPVAIPKTGQCPSGFTQSGAYCLEMRRR
jgi:hypothetical protein